MCLSGSVILRAEGFAFLPLLPFRYFALSFSNGHDVLEKDQWLCCKHAIALQQNKGTGILGVPV